jgi:hypothetical protein
LKPVFVVLLLSVFLFFIDFGLDNYFLYKNLRSFKVHESLYYADKLRNIYLPTKYGRNYTNSYNAIYYALNSYQSYQTGSPSSIKAMGDKSLEYAKKVDGSLYFTQKEKSLYKKYQPMLYTLAQSGQYLDLLKLQSFAAQDQTILVLIQNSNELRPTGGFIGSYALLKTSEYKVKDYKFDDIYNIDGTLKEKYPEVLTSVPLKYKEFIKTEALFARDLNLILDTKTRNELILKYFETALNTDIDAVVYLNLDSVGRVLGLTGPIYLGSYNAEVTQDNFDTLAQNYSESNYYEGSSQKKNFLNVLGARTVSAFYENPKNLVTESTLPILIQALKAKEVLVYFKSQDLNNAIASLNLPEKIFNKSEDTDYIYVIENNLGENKVNKLTEKKVEYNLVYDQRRGIKSSDISVNLVNMADTYNWPYGDYKGILHIVLPDSVKITSAKNVRAVNTSDPKSVDILRTLDIENINNVLVINIPFIVAPQSASNIKVSIEELDKEFVNKDSYTLFVQKQPGSKPYEFVLNFNIPDIKKETLKHVIESDKVLSL